MDWRTDLGAGTLDEGPVHHLKAPSFVIAPRALSNTVGPTSGRLDAPCPGNRDRPVNKHRFRTEPEGTASHVDITGAEIFHTTFIAPTCSRGQPDRRSYVRCFGGDGYAGAAILRRIEVQRPGMVTTSWLVRTSGCGTSSALDRP